jgi:hypothetical protein
LYNAALEERMDAWHKAGQSSSYAEQQNALQQIKAKRPEFIELGSHAEATHAGLSTRERHGNLCRLPRKRWRQSRR